MQNPLLEEANLLLERDILVKELGLALTCACMTGGLTLARTTHTHRHT